MAFLVFYELKSVQNFKTNTKNNDPRTRSFELIVSLQSCIMLYSKVSMLTSSVYLSILKHPTYVRNVASHEVTKVSKWIPQSRYRSPLCRCQSRHKALQNQDNQNHKGLGALGHQFYVLPSYRWLRSGNAPNGIQMAHCLPNSNLTHQCQTRQNHCDSSSLMMIFGIPAVKTPPHFSSALQTARASFRASFSARLGPWTALTHDLFQGNHHFYRWYMVV